MVVRKIKKLSVTSISDEFYKVLGIDSSASENDVKKAFRKLALKHHPDHNIGDKEAEKNFIEITEAYNMIVKVGFGCYEALYLSEGSDMGDAERAYERIFNEIISDSKLSNEKKEEKLGNIKNALDYFRTKVGYKNSNGINPEHEGW